jgi:probable phosphoglycerate mutase
VRHGRTAHNATGRIQGQLDVDLDDVGRAQAVAVADALAEATPYAVISSDLVRARATAEQIAWRAGVQLTLDARLREISLGRWEGLTGDEARERFPEEHAAWLAGEDVRRGGGETYAEVGLRARACIDDALADVPAGSTLIAVTHGGTARGALGCLLEIDAADWWRFAPLGNTCWSVVVEGDRGWRLERHNTGVGSQVGAAVGAHDLGGQPVGGSTSSPDVEPVK